MAVPILTFPYGTREYVMASVSADRDLDEQVVEMRISPNNWQDADWVGDPGETRVVSTSSPVDFANLSRSIPHPVYVRFTDAPEIPIIHVGTIRVVS